MVGPTEVPRIFGIGLVQDEEDVIGESVAWAGRFCERIWLWDLGSSDRTWEILSAMASERFVVSQKSDLKFTGSLRAEVFAEARPHLPDGAWVYTLDADEFLVGDPRPLLARATRTKADMVKAWSLVFRPTQEDVVRMETLGEDVWSAIPLIDRLRSFTLDHSLERRFTRLSPGLTWTAAGKDSRLRLADGTKPKVFPRKAMVRHYRHRSPAQVARRFELRQRRREAGYAGFGYDKAADFRGYAVPERSCRLWRPDQQEPALTWADFLRYQVTRLQRLLRRGR